MCTITLVGELVLNMKVGQTVRPDLVSTRSDWGATHESKSYKTIKGETLRGRTIGIRHVNGNFGNQ